MRNVAALMDEVGAALQFFDGFGENWHALEECLSYLDEWLPAEAYVLVVEQAEQVLNDEPQSLPALLKTLDSAAQFWSKPIVGNGRFDRSPIPLHVLLLTPPEDTASYDRFALAALEAAIGMRRLE